MLICGSDLISKCAFAVLSCLSNGCNLLDRFEGEPPEHTGIYWNTITVLSTNPAHLSYCAGHNFNTEKKRKCNLATLQSLSNVEPIGLPFFISSFNLLSVEAINYATVVFLRH